MIKKSVKITAVLCTVAMLLSFAGCFDVNITYEGGSDIEDEIQSFISPSGTEEYTTAASNFEVENSDGTTDAGDTGTQQSSVSTTAASSSGYSTTPDKMTNADLVEFFNDSVNTIKTKKPAFTKAKTTKVLDIELSNSAANSVVGIVKSALLSEDTETTPVSKGQDCTNIVSPSGSTFVSRMSMGDTDGVTCTKQGSNYVITIKVYPQTNPEKNNGVMSDVFDFITVDDVINTYAPKVNATVTRENIEINFSDCYAKLTADASGKVISYETYVKGEMNMNNATIKASVISIDTDVKVTLASTTTYTDFSF